jgi:hypothetical protein
VSTRRGSGAAKESTRDDNGSKTRDKRKRRDKSVVKCKKDDEESGSAGHDFRKAGESARSLSGQDTSNKRAKVSYHIYAFAKPLERICFLLASICLLEVIHSCSGPGLRFIQAGG